MDCEWTFLLHRRLAIVSMRFFLIDQRYECQCYFSKELSPVVDVFFCGHSLNLLIYWFRVWPRSIAWNLRDTRMIPYTHFLSDTQTNWKSTPISVQTGVLRSTRWIWKIFGWNLKYNKSNCAEQKRVRIFACTSICISVNSPPSYEQRTQLDRSIFWSVIMVMFFESTIQPLHRAFRHSLI